MSDDNPSSNPYTTSSLIGISVAVGGNVLISLALNCQKLAHKRLQKSQQTHTDTIKHHRNPEQAGTEIEPLLPGPGASSSPHSSPRRPHSNLRHSYTSIGPSPTSVWTSDTDTQENVTGIHDGRNAVAIEVTTDHHVSATGYPNLPKPGKEHGCQPKNETAYLRSRLWWLGFILMNVGEVGNFISYAFAPASVVAPLGTVALIANCFFAPIMLKEKLRKRDLLGVVLAIFGAVTIVGAGKLSDIRLDPDALIKAISRRAFVVYAIVSLSLIVIFGILSAGPAGRDYVIVDVGLCALFGGFTVLSTKAISTLLSLRFWGTFQLWITYPILTALIATGVGQVKYLNRALMKFDSKVVIPTFFVCFNISAIVGSAILYGDFENVQVHQFTTFLYGCATTFLGVFLLTRSSEEAGMSLEEPVALSDGVQNRRESIRDSEGQSVQAGPAGLPVLRGKQSSASLVLSPGKYLLYATSPPRGSILRETTTTTTSLPGSPRR